MTRQGVQEHTLDMLTQFLVSRLGGSFAAVTLFAIGMLASEVSRPLGIGICVAAIVVWWQSWAD